jgi:very-short-patch-repair endonuclease
MNRFLGNQVVTYRPQMSPERSIYDLYKVVFAKSSVMLKEHFRCVAPIIEYSKREFYNHELRPLRIPKASERLDPPLIDVLVQDGYRNGDVNLPEARYIVDEIKTLTSDPAMSGRSIGVVSLLADKQALKIWERLTEELGPDVIERHRIACGDARTFQGKERDIMFLSMVSAPNDVGAPLSRDTFAQRFNVAASRAKDRMYLVRSLGMENLSDADRMRRNLISHFSTPFNQDQGRAEDLRKLCESPFEREMYDELIQRGYWVVPQVHVGHYRIDLVVEGHNDARLAVECDGDKYHGPDKWADDMQRQRVLERAGWIFWRCFASTFLRRRKTVVDDLLKSLAEHGIEPIGAEGAPLSVHTEQRIVSALAREERNSEIMSAELEPVPGSNVITAMPSSSNSEIRPNSRLDHLVSLDIPTLENFRSSNANPRRAAETSLVPSGFFEHGEQELKEFCRLNGLDVEDKRPKGGRLWIYHYANDDEVASQLTNWGFLFVPDKGYWHR